MLALTPCRLLKGGYCENHKPKHVAPRVLLVGTEYYAFFEGVVQVAVDVDPKLKDELLPAITRIAALLEA